MVETISLDEVREESVSPGEVQIKIEGDLFKTLLELGEEIEGVDVGQPATKVVKGVVAKAIALLLRSRGHDIILRDRRRGVSEVISLWR